MPSSSTPCKCANDPKKTATTCLGRCEIPKHQCTEKDDLKVRVPKNMGWLYTARDSPGHQLRCGWRPGHISNPVLRAIQENRCMKYCGQCGSCIKPGCYNPDDYPCCKPRCHPSCSFN